MAGVLPALLAAAAAAQAQIPAAPPPKEVSPLVVSPAPKDAPPADATVNVAADQDAAGVVIWPEGALQRGIGGYVTLACQVDVHGLAETCRVIYENPAGRRFGQAALALRPTFKLPPRQQPAMLNIAVSFRAKPFEADLAEVSSAQMGSSRPNGRTIIVHNNPATGRAMTMMTEAAWAQAPDFAAWAAAYPAEGGGAEGYAVAHCRVESGGVLGRCAVAKEQPAGRGFGKAAVALARKFRVAPEAMAAAPRGAPIEVDVPVRFPPPAEASGRVVRAPVWIAGSDPFSLASELPPSPPGLAPGRGALVRCTVAETGQLAGCGVELASPDGLAFDEAAVRLASRLRMNLWSGEAGPVVGGAIHLPIRAEMAAEAPARN